jgi:hypothetical protein
MNVVFGQAQVPRRRPLIPGKVPRRFLAAGFRRGEPRAKQKNLAFVNRLCYVESNCDRALTRCIHNGADQEAHVARLRQTPTTHGRFSHANLCVARSDSPGRGGLCAALSLAREADWKPAFSPGRCSGPDQIPIIPPIYL